MQEPKPVTAILDRLSIILSKLSRSELSSKNRERYHQLGQKYTRLLEKIIGGLDGR